MFADALDPTDEVTDADEADALGALVCARIGTGVYSSLDDAMVRVVRLLVPTSPSRRATTGSRRPTRPTRLWPKP